MAQELPLARLVPVMGRENTMAKEKRHPHVLEASPDRLQEETIARQEPRPERAVQHQDLDR